MGLFCIALGESKRSGDQYPGCAKHVKIAGTFEAASPATP
jgi:hypothetical protein